MESHSHNFTSLFDQLGLPSNESQIKFFIDEHYPLDSTTPLCDASFWTPGQAKFLREQIKLDADWCVVIDKLDASLRQS